ncbi:alpha/beta hydrolase, partial [Comamonas sp.]|uniref:alpha/beta fold hydrolase n=1 Tax=Comamonas sp. TaxID=34028 RepID=UPI0025C49FA8
RLRQTTGGKLPRPCRLTPALQQTSLHQTRCDSLLVSEAQREYAKTIAAFASPKGTHDCIASFSRTDFRDDLKKIDVPTLIIHGDSDRIVPLEVSGARTHDAVKGSEIHIIKNGPHGCNLSHAEEFNRALIDFIAAH